MLFVMLTVQQVVDISTWSFMSWDRGGSHSVWVPRANSVYTCISSVSLSRVHMSFNGAVLFIETDLEGLEGKI